ncbi:helix-turn-helix domain-containing protein [Pelagibacterium halotolerans]|uniref:Transcriptional regulatory protein n=1 Tax=Pelagibacterium halotolerans (strain DSM 22347 / JCM 15775 / CGMCC 1.7692 / B2) TaxID=1082931 RepID=G4RCS1_PELHB|nr:helix-turn-helix domain-containing protein [Pelagibacterium halotolerans]AEQ51726.1 transcriptional regulatory protein [Pelagibacterium halotolerans B2]QJR18454.1 helix-turn-helix domain-containing protein [Pelagibacterium halotolerans]SEA21529.1 transcriptional regulator, AraC family [Pelagibacterium halotolerans]
MAAAIPHSLFSTDTLDPANRFGAWRDQLSVVFDPHLSDTLAPERFSATVSGYRLGALSHMRCRATSQHFVRDRRKIDADGLDNYMIQIFRRGECVASSPKGEVVMKAGEICIFDNAQPLDSCNSDFDLLSLFVPREMLAPLISYPDSRHLSHIAADSPLAALLHNHLAMLHQTADELTWEDAQLLVGPTLSLLAATLNGAPDAAEGSERAIQLALTTTIKRFVDENLASPELSAETLMEAFGVSRARLYRLFGAYDGVATYIRDRRLGMAMTILRNPAQQSRKIIDIAYATGFGSESSFIRAFRRRYGHTPADCRLDHTPSAHFAIADPIDSNWSDWMRSA